MSALSKVWVVSEAPERFAALGAVGRRLGERVEAVAVGGGAAQAAASCGAEAVYTVAVPEGGLVEDCAAAIAGAAGEHAPRAVLFAAGKRTRLMAARVAAELGTRVLNDVGRIWVDDGALLAEHMVYGGKAFAVERVREGCAVALLAEGLLVSEPVVEGAAREAAVSELPAASAAASARLVERRPRTVESVNLAAARRVVSVGRGVAAQEDLALVDELAAALEAEVGCTRPVAEGSGWMARERYIGVSGALLKPDLFVAVGLSGQIQHMVGANSAKTIVAVNKDKNAPVFKQCDYGIVADLYEVLPKLSAALGA
ncbi:FAD-binding protein [Gordonibacter sp. RACS_AR49]|uniref:FAD-binding protein n=1 Tax=Gordonibacter sp. RACS_AR49 TaxID=2871986 RepID=UPI00260EF18F|nr:FAD-binding protein [Gordonibacter sp. RACS_AR49]MDN4510378.1 FAD-binding protein [Gordonibacter sp. RACS_AR49]